MAKVVRKRLLKVPAVNDNDVLLVYLVDRLKVDNNAVCMCSSTKNEINTL